MASSIFPIILNQTHADPNDTSTYRYRFNRGSAEFKDKKARVALQKLNLFYSWRNIDSELYNNNKFQMIFPDGSPLGFTEYNIFIDNGNYDVDSLNKWLQNWFIQNNKYLINSSTGAYRFFYEIITNPQTYKIQLISHEIPISMPPSFQNPTGGTFSFPTVPNQQPTLVVLPFTQSNFGKLIGFSQGGYFDAVSNLVPEINPCPNVVVTCSLAAGGRYTNPSDIIYSFVTGTTQYGSMLNIEPQNLIFHRINDGIYHEVVVKFYNGQTFSKLPIIDTQISIHLLIQIDD